MKKGFTLIELLAVVIVLSLLVIIVGTSVTKIVGSSKEKLYSEVQLESIKNSAELWGAYNMNTLSEIQTCKYITLETLVEADLINDTIVNVKDTKNNLGDVYISITKQGNNYIYEVVVGANNIPSGCVIVGG